jgi:hypothetical protein
MRKVSLKKVLRNIANTPIFTFHGYGTGRLFEDDMVDRYFEGRSGIAFERNARLVVPGALLGNDYPHAEESIEVDVLSVRRPKSAARAIRSGYEMKYQSCPGTAEDKIVASAYRLTMLVRARKIDYGFIVIGGDAWNSFPLYAAASLHPKVKVISEVELASMSRRGIL